MTEQRRDLSEAAAVPEHDMLALLADAEAEPLLPDTFPVPVRYGGRWWHQLSDGPTSDFVAVADDLASRYDDLLQRHREAAGAGHGDESPSDG